MQAASQPIQLYVDLPQQLYSQRKLILCSGYSPFQFERLELWAGSQKVGECKAIFHYDTKTGQVQKRAFAIIGYLNLMDRLDEILFKLRFITAKESIDYKAGKAMVKTSLKKIVAKKPNSILIILPAYQPDISLFKQQVSSILQQTYIRQDRKHHKDNKQHPIEIMIQDDGSDEKTVDQIKQFIEPFANIHFFKNEKNLGFYNNIESMLYRVGKGFSYVAFSDQDDIWHPQKLEKQVEQLTKNQADLVYSDLEIVDENGKQLQNTFWVNRSNHINDYHALCVNNVATGSTMFFKAALLSKLLPFPQQAGKVYHDHWICTFLKNTKHKIIYIDEALVQYIQHEHNVTGYQSYKTLSLRLRILSFASLWFTFVKLIFKKDIRALNKFIELHQRVYFTNVQRLKLFYIHLSDLDLHQNNHPKTDIILLFRLFFLSFKTILQNIYLNRSEVALYSAIVVMFGLRWRYFFKKKNE